MSPINFVCIFVVVCLKRGPCVAAADNDRMVQPSDIREEVVSAFDKFVNYTANHDMNAMMEMIHPDTILMMDGLPAIFGREAIRPIDEAMLKNVDRIQINYAEVTPMDAEGEYVLVLTNYKFYNHAGAVFADMKGVFIWKNTDDGYKNYIPFVTHNTQTI